MSTNVRDLRAFATTDALRFDEWDLPVLAPSVAVAASGGLSLLGHLPAATLGPAVLAAGGAMLGMLTRRRRVELRADGARAQSRVLVGALPLTSAEVVFKRPPRRVALRIEPTPRVLLVDDEGRSLLPDELAVTKANARQVAERIARFYGIDVDSLSGTLDGTKLACGLELSVFARWQLETQLQHEELRGDRVHRWSSPTHAVHQGRAWMRVDSGRLVIRALRELGQAPADFWIEASTGPESFKSVGGVGLVSVELVDPWPALRIEHRRYEQRHSIELTPMGPERAAFALAAEAVAQIAQRQRSCAVKLGWSALAVARFEHVSAMPVFEPSSLGGGPFRAPAFEGGEGVVAEHVSTGAARTNAQVDDHTTFADAITLTESFLYVRDHGTGRVGRIALSSLRRVDDVDGACACALTFGRSTRVLAEGVAPELVGTLRRLAREAGR